MKKRIAAIFNKVTSFFKSQTPPQNQLKTDKPRKAWRLWILAAVALVAVFWAIAWYMGSEPKSFDVIQTAAARAQARNQTLVTGYTTTSTLITVAETLLDKPGGYLSNDMMPPSVLMDDIPNWEFGVLMQVRDLARSLRNDISRSRSQSQDNPELAEAEPNFSFDHSSWLFTQGRYRKAIAATDRYLDKLSAQSHMDTQFYARADNLSEWLALVEKRLGSLSQRLSACVGQARINTDLAGDGAATQSTQTPSRILVKTPWLKLDDVFYESRGATWALLHFLKAIQKDFESVLEKKNAKALVQQIVRELEGAQRRVWSPMILNGNGFGFFANHSLVMASYISRANAAIIDLRDLLSQG